MKQLLRKGLKQIIVDEVPDPVVTPHHVLVRPLYSLISSGTETASIHQEGVLRAVADNPSQITNDIRTHSLTAESVTSGKTFKGSNSPTFGATLPNKQSDTSSLASDKRFSASCP